MRLTFQHKLMLSYLLLTLVCGGALMGYLYHRLDANLTDEISRSQLSQTRLAAALLARNAAETDLHSLAREAGAAINARMTLIAPNGTVRADSGVAPENVSRMENHLDRPEIAAARTAGTGVSIRYSETLKSRMIYVAVPFTAGNQAGYIRTALPLAVIDRTRSELHTILGVAALAAVGLSFVLSWLLSSLTVKPLESMVQAARRFGTGDFSGRIPVAGSDEVGELAGVLNDMASDIRHNLERLAEEKNRLDGILRGMGEGVLVTDADGRVQLVNPAFCEMFALDSVPDGSMFIEICRHPQLVASFRRATSGEGELRDELELADPPRSLLTHWVPLNDAAGLHGVVAVFHDISQIKRLEKVRRDFVANVSHELRTPISVISGYAETLLSDNLIQSNPEQARRFMGVIHSHTGRLARLLDDILALSRLDSSLLTLSIAPVDIASLLENSRSLTERSAAAKGVSVVCLPVAEGLVVEGDEVRLEQVLVNLLDNAIKYTPPGGSVTVSARTTGPDVELCVADTGIGIPEKDLHRIFERFYRVDPARSREQGGTGLGLSIVKHLIGLHGGEITVESTPGTGSVFTVRLKTSLQPLPTIVSPVT